MTSEKGSHNNGRNILLIADKSSITDPISELLISNEYTITLMDGWKEALSEINHKKPDLIIGAYDDNIEDPVDFQELLKSEGSRIDIPVLIMGPSNIDVDFFIKALLTGMDYHITLPCERGYLLSRIEDVIEHHRGYDIQNERISFEFAYRNDHHRFDTYREQLVNFLLSSFENTVHQNRLLIRNQKETVLIGDAETPYKKDDSSHRLDERTGELIGAIENKEFVLYYQPIVLMKTGRISGFEALIRWDHPEKGIVSPDEFIPLAEETGLIIPLGFWIIEEACRQLKVWQEKFPSDPHLTVSINLSTVQFVHPELAERIGKSVKDSGVDPNTVRFEITESALMEDMQSANIMLLKLRAMNFKLYMDDFGTGYSSLSYLRHFPVDVLKIDQSFVKWMGVDEESDEIVRTIVSLAHSLKMMVIAEGVETEEHLRKLSELGCEYGQGFFLSKPLDAESIEELLLSKPQW